MTFRSHRGGNLRPAALFSGLLAGVAALLTPAADAETPAAVVAVLDNAPRAAEHRCSYTRIRNDEDQRRERYRAGHDPPWQLLAMDGREPSEEELRRYAQGADDRDRRHPLAFDLRAMVSPDGWRLVEETPSEAIYEFRLRPNEDLDEGLVDKVRGTMVVDTVRDQPISISIENTEPAYVAPLVRIASYHQRLSFRWSDAVGASVLTEAVTRWHGRALGFRRINKYKHVIYEGYQCRAEVADTDS
ncbi:MAG: hypothetical protein U5Q16_08295 [Gammaproteobacteria bacterium]|nr:hypothetical protein [Gammaproteobacteria bacterium]